MLDTFLLTNRPTVNNLGQRDIGRFQAECHVSNGKLIDS